MKHGFDQYAAKLVGNKDERAVSPVIGVILMVAITVILAAVIAAFVLDMGDLNESAPNAQYDWESNGDNTVVTVTHTSGEDIDLSNIVIRVTGEAGTDSAEFDSTDFTAGDEITFENDAGNDELSVSGDASLPAGEDLHSAVTDTDEIEEVVFTWESDGSSSIIADYET
ncbi:type IV pilin [Natronococcus pandeyae]|uniref:Type IV pilin n=1 Tax=Natronococcus pandeyae TaxID=2055836 RepID=A0A8J8TPM3_9EURY|nr:type IV pilin N-terminal domain-containing protein [Natronococcus pandeyae]TYL37583.1 type IV pilin [Natronococcus pandeyae]